MLKLLIIRHMRLRSYRTTLKAYKNSYGGGILAAQGDCGKYIMLVIQQQIAADLQPHKKCSIIADGTYDSRKREATVFVTGESHTFGDLSVKGSSLRRE